MPNQYKNSRYNKRSRSSSQPHSHHRDRRTYNKQKDGRYDKYHRRSRSKTPPRQDPSQPKYHSQYQQQDEKRYYQSRRNDQRSRHHQMSYSRRNYSDKRQRQKIDQYPLTLKYNHNQQKYHKYRDHDQHFQKIRNQDRDSRDYKSRKNSSSRSRSSSRKKPQGKTAYRRKSPQREKEEPKRYQRQKSAQNYRKIQQERVSPPKPQANQTQHQQMQQNQTYLPNKEHLNYFQSKKKQEQRKPFFKLKTIPPPPLTHQPTVQQKQMEVEKLDKPYLRVQQISQQQKGPSKQKQLPREWRQQQMPVRVKVNKFDLLIEQARNNLSVGPPKSTFLILDTFRTMNKFQVQMLDPKWMAFLKKDMERYPEQRQQIMTQISELSPNQQNYEQHKIVGRQYVWMKQQRNEHQLDLRFRLQEFKQHNANLSELVRKIRLLD